MSVLCSVSMFTIYNMNLKFVNKPLIVEHLVIDLEQVQVNIMFIISLCLRLIVTVTRTCSTLSIDKNKHVNSVNTSV